MLNSNTFNTKQNGFSRMICDEFFVIELNSFDEFEIGSRLFTRNGEVPFCRSHGYAKYYMYDEYLFIHLLRIWTNFHEQRS